MTQRPRTSESGSRSRKGSPPPPHSLGMWGASSPISRTRPRSRSISRPPAPKPRSRTSRSTGRTSSSRNRRTVAVRLRTASETLKSMGSPLWDAMATRGSLARGCTSRTVLLDFVYRSLMAQENWEDPVIEAYKRDVDLTLLRKNLRLTPEERILAAMELQRLAEEVRRAGREG